MRVLAALPLLLAFALPARAADPAPELDALLDRIEARDETVLRMESRLRLVRKQGLLGDEQVRFGMFRYQAAPRSPLAPRKALPAEIPAPAKFRVDFDGVVVGGQKDNADIRYVFDGFWLLEANAKTHAATRREVRAKNDPKDALAQGGGTFPLPLPFKKTALLARFDVALGKEGKTEDGREAMRLILTPKPGVKAEADRLELTFEKDTLLPVAAQSQKGEDSTEIFLAKPAFNPELPKDCFDTALPEGKEWQTQEVPLQ